MIRYKRGTKLWLISAILMLTALLLSIDVTGAWFTSGDGLKIECTIKVGQFNLQVYQVVGGTETQIYTNEDNDTATTKSYVDLTSGDGSGTREILPDVAYGLTLKLKNNDKGTDSFYVRYKINLVICGKSAGNRVLNATWTGANGEFTLVDGWYYYGTSESNLREYTSGKNLEMCTGFNIPYSEFYNNGYNCDNIKLEVVIECSDTAVF